MSPGFLRVRLPILIAASLFALYGCVNKPDPPSEAPTGVTATAGDGVILMSWDQLPDLTYWIFYAPGDTVTPGQVGSFAIKNAVSPRAVAGLQNDTQYALLMNATSQGSAAGPNSQVVTKIPRLAGDNWTKGAVQGVQNLNALAFNGFGRYVTVGDGTTLFAGDFNYGHTDPVGVTEWFGGPTTIPPTTWFPSTAFPSIPPGGTTVPPFNDDFKAVTFNGSFVALGSNGHVATSVDGVNWFPQHPVLASGVTGLNGLAWGITVTTGATYFAVGDGGQMYMTNDLTVDWKPVASGTTSDLTSITLLNGFFILTGADGTLLAGVDGVNWTQQTIVPPLPAGTTLRSAAFMLNAFGVVSVENGQTVKGICFVAVGDNGAIVTTTTDGMQRDPNNGNIVLPGTWTSTLFSDTSGAPNLRSVTVGGATGLRFLAVGQGGAAVFGDSLMSDRITPINPIFWRRALQPQTGDLSSVHFFLGQYLAVGSAGGNAVSH